eukprot:7084719-Prymnesium_polylepis.1
MLRFLNGCYQLYGYVVCAPRIGKAHHRRAVRRTKKSPAKSFGFTMTMTNRDSPPPPAAP